MLERTGIAGDRAFYLVDADGRLMNAKRAGGLLRASAETDDGRLRVALPDGSVVEGDPELGEPARDRLLRASGAGRVVHGAVGTGSVGARLAYRSRSFVPTSPAPGLDRGAGGRGVARLDCRRSTPSRRLPVSIVASTGDASA